MLSSRWWSSTVLMAAGLAVTLAACADGGGEESPSDMPAPPPREATPRPTNELTAAAATPPPTPTPVQAELDACRGAFRDAAAVSALQDRVEDLDPAVRACSSVVEWETASAEFPNALDGVNAEQFARNRCQFGSGLSGTPLCREVIGEFTDIDARDRVLECLAALPPSAAVDVEASQLRRGISSLRFDGGWVIERSDPAKFDLPGFPSWEVLDSGRVLAVSDAAAALIPGRADVLCG